MGEASSIECFICDEVREEARSKLALLGVYFDSISFEKSAWEQNKKLRMRHLHFCCMIKGVEGPRTVEWKIVQPSGNVLGGKAAEVHVDFVQRMGLILRAQSVVFEELGEHLFCLALDGKPEYQKEFEVGVSDQI